MESGQRMLQLCERLVDMAIRPLHKRCTSSSGEWTNEDFYKESMHNIRVWPVTILERDLAALRDAHPDCDETYRQCFAQYARERFGSGDRRRTAVQPPEMLSFYRILLEEISKCADFRGGTYFFDDTTHGARREACMEMARDAMNALTSPESVQVDLVSEVSGAVSRRGHDDDEIGPEDSVSQIGVDSARQQRVRQAEEEARCKAKEAEEEARRKAEEAEEEEARRKAEEEEARCEAAEEDARREEEEEAQRKEERTRCERKKADGARREEREEVVDRYNYPASEASRERP